MASYTTVKGTRPIIIAHICSQCKQPVVHKLMLMAEGAANALLHERQKAAEAQEQAFQQAYKDIAECRRYPRRLGSATEVGFDTNRKSAYYQILQLDTPCAQCGHVEAWQKSKQSIWNPMEGSFYCRELIPNVPMESRPALLDSQAAVDAWLADPAGKVISQTDQLSGANETASAQKEPWICSKCKTTNNGRVKTCQSCGVTKEWSDSHAKK